MTNLETEREDFEKWVVSEGIDLVLIKVSASDDRYLSPNTCTAYRAWLARAEAEGWRPIESAPRDGTPILVCYADHYVSNGFLPISVRWRSYHPNAKGEEEFRDISGTRVRRITHWMPLPAPPKEDGE